jgi:septation ring formation regulator EzrA
MNTPDIAGLCERLRKLTRSFKQYMGASSVEDMVKAADTLERQADEIERLREALEEADRLLAALTGEDTATLGLSGETQTDARTRGDECTS